MNTSRRLKLMPLAIGGVTLALIGLMGLGLAWAAGKQGLADVLDSPAVSRSGPERSITTSVAASGKRLLSVGPRGLILLSTDEGGSWKQVPSPVSADLTSVRFMPSGLAWAVGHDAVILKSSDGGSTWVRALDGRALLKTLKLAGEKDAKLAREIDRTMAQSATADVWPAAILDIGFVDAQRGFAVGAFGLLLATVDGGTTWQPWSSRSENERSFHLYAINGDDARPYIAGEQGLLLRLDEAGERFLKVETPYNGSYFGVQAKAGQVLAYGLRGSAYLSADSGANWRRIETGTEANIVAGSLDNNKFWLASQRGDFLSGDVAGGSLVPVKSAPGPDLYGAALARPGRLALARLNGVSVLDTSLAR